jgi:hypothetical protein
MPVGLAESREARLETFGPDAVPGNHDWKGLTSWWLKHSAGANTPNWDIALGCDVGGKPGLILVEAKANHPELKASGKSVPKRFTPPSRSEGNHAHIADAISKASEALTAHIPKIALSHETHYQLSNRIAFAWKLADMGVPTVLVYLGFLGDEEIESVGQPFADADQWKTAFEGHFQAVCPTTALERRYDVGKASFWILSRCRDVTASRRAAAH